MKITNNHRIISLYSTVFIIISLTTIYLPVWLHEIVGLELKDIGVLFGLIGVLKVFSSILITKNIIKFSNYKTTSVYITILVSLIYLLIVFLLIKQQQILIIILIFLSLIIFSPILPMTENISLKLNSDFKNTYGKLRISGSAAFFLSAIILGYFIDGLGSKVLPFLMIFFFWLFLISIYSLPSDQDKYYTYKKGSILQLLKNKKFLIVLLCCGLIQGSHAMYYSFSSILWRNNEISFSQIGYLWGWGVLAEIILFYFIDKVNINGLFLKILIFAAITSSFRWILTYFFNQFYSLLFIQTLHAISFGLAHYLMMHFIFFNIESKNQLLAQAFYHAIASGMIMTSLTFISGYSFLYYKNGEGFLIMALSCIISALVIIISSLWIVYEKKQKK
jgi:PPP family 3-phenylpropionic acid transporter